MAQREISTDSTGRERKTASDEALPSTPSRHASLTSIWCVATRPTFSKRLLAVFLSFFFQAEDGIRDLTVTGVQTCALPICTHRYRRNSAALRRLPERRLVRHPAHSRGRRPARSEQRRRVAALLGGARRQCRGDRKSVV